MENTKKEGICIRRIAVICGKGELAKKCIDACRVSGELSCVIAIKGTHSMEKFPCPFIDIHIGQIGAALDFIKMHNSTHVVLIGGVKRPSIISGLSLDSVGRHWFAKLGHLMFSGDDKLLRGVSTLLEKENLKIIGVDDILNDIVASDDVITRLTPDDLALSDIKRGVDVAIALGKVDVGQSTIIQQGVVLGVEAKEGTDALIDRCAGLGLDGPGGVLVKLMKPGQDKRLDMPVIGAETVKRAAAAGLRGIALEEGNVLVFDKKGVINAADSLGLFITSVKVNTN